MAKGLIIAAPHSGSGKTLVTLGLLRALNNRGLRVASAKFGPDYIDPAFHSAATGKPCLNLDPWSMGEAQVRHRAAALAAQSDVLVVEGAMGLFDGPQGAAGSTADLAAMLNLPVLLVVDAARQSQSIAALVQGFQNFRTDVNVAGVVLNRVASDRHEAMLRQAVESVGAEVLAVLRHNDSLHMPSRHLGLVQAQENQQLESFIESAAATVARETFLDNVLQIAANFTNHAATSFQTLPALGKSIAIARDAAFSFLYPHLLDDWRSQGVACRFFSPLANEAPPPAEALYLPGGYPELHAGRLAANAHFLEGVKAFPGLIYGECGGYMVLGNGLVDAEGQLHTMAGLLPVTTTFAKRKLQLGYRHLKPLGWPFAAPLRGHEFHYSSVSSMGAAEPLFHAHSAAGDDLGPMGQRVGRVMGSYAHIISVAP